MNRLIDVIGHTPIVQLNQIFSDRRKFDLYMKME